MKCAICRAESVEEYAPFCSRRCANVDLSKWLSGSYAVPSNDPEDLEIATEASARELQKPH